MGADRGVPATLDRRRLLANLRDDRWAVAALLPAFRGELERSTGIGGVSLTALSMLRYGLARTAPAVLAQPPAGLVEQRDDAATRRFWDRAAGHVVRGAVHRPADEQQRAVVAAALVGLRAVAPGTRDALDRCLTRLVVLDGPSFGSASHPWLFGSIFCHHATLAAEPDAVASMLVHELAHHELFLLNLVDRLIRAESDAERRFAPFQGRERPAIGRLHAAHALARMLGLARCSGAGERHLAESLRATLATLPPRLLTPFGAELVKLHAATHGAATSPVDSTR